ncbi:virulence-associated E family protein [Myxococcota bacterium]|nr:virulence-associated E family protein [Myxococcota bacterium]
MARSGSPALEVAGVQAEGPPDHVLELMERSDKGQILACLTNLVTILEQDPQFQDRLCFDEFRRRVLLDGEPVSDEAETALNVAISNRYGVRPLTHLVGEAARHVARQHPRHPVREYLEGLTWDGVERCPYWLYDHLGAEGTTFVRAVAAAFLVGAVARVMQPGCKVDTTLILQGAQGIGKSQAFAVLAGRDWFSDSPIDFGTKDAFQGLPGVWIYELAELDSVRRSETSAVKAFLSAQVDHYRPSYGRNTVDVPRQNVFVGTTNEVEFLRDPSGSRRFWPVAVAHADLDGLRNARDQLWAEALVRFRRGEPWWLSPDAEQARVEASEPYRAVDAWEEPVRRWTEDRVEPFTVDEVLNHAIGKDTDRHETRDTMRVAALLGRLGFSKKRMRLGEGRQTLWGRWDQPGEGA